jgi:hypothetical protein
VVDNEVKGDFEHLVLVEDVLQQRMEDLTTQLEPLLAKQRAVKKRISFGGFSLIGEVPKPTEGNVRSTPFTSGKAWCKPGLKWGQQLCRDQSEFAG